MVGLGANMSGPLGEPADYIAAALDQIRANDRVSAVQSSALYRTKPWGKTDQDDFINAVAEVFCDFTPEALLESLLSIELDLGRRRATQWGPRLIDLDLLTFEDRVIDSDRLTLPHPRMHERAFVLVPLLEIDPDFRIPGLGRADECLAALGDAQGVEPA